MKRSTGYNKKSGKKAAPKKAAKKAAPKKAAKKQGASKTAYKNAYKKAIFSRENKREKVIAESNYIEVIGATYVKNNVLLISFSDGKKKQVDFGTFFQKETPFYLKKYKAPSKFKNFKIEDGNVVWGRDWDLIFPVEQLYEGYIK